MAGTTDTVQHYLRPCGLCRCEYFRRLVPTSPLNRGSLTGTAQTAGPGLQVAFPATCVRTRASFCLRFVATECCVLLRNPQKKTFYNKTYIVALVWCECSNVSLATVRVCQVACLPFTHTCGWLCLCGTCSHHLVGGPGTASGLFQVGRSNHRPVATAHSCAVHSHPQRRRHCWAHVVCGVHCAAGEWPSALAAAAQLLAVLFHCCKSLCHLLRPSARRKAPTAALQPFRSRFQRPVVTPLRGAQVACTSLLVYVAAALRGGNLHNAWTAKLLRLLLGLISVFGPILARSVPHARFKTV